MYSRKRYRKSKLKRTYRKNNKIFWGTVDSSGRFKVYNNDKVIIIGKVSSPDIGKFTTVDFEKLSPVVIERLSPADKGLVNVPKQKIRLYLKNKNSYQPRKPDKSNVLGKKATHRNIKKSRGSGLYLSGGGRNKPDFDDQNWRNYGLGIPFK